MQRAGSLALVAVLLVAADAPHTDQEQIHGTWVRTSRRFRVTYPFTGAIEGGGARRRWSAS